MAQTRSGKINSRGKAPAQRAASTENYPARFSTGFITLGIAALVVVSYFVSDGAVIMAIKNFTSGVFGYGYWGLGVCLLWIAVMFFKGTGSGLRIFSVFMIPVLFSCFAELLSYTPSETAFSFGIEVEHLYAYGQMMKCGGVIPGLMVLFMVKLLSKVGTGALIVLLLLVFAALAVSEPAGWFNSRSKRNSAKEKSPRQARNAVISPVKKASRFDPSKLFVIKDEEFQNPGNADVLPEIPDNEEYSFDVPGIKVPQGAGTRTKFVSDIPLYKDQDEFDMSALKKPRPKPGKHAAAEEKNHPAPAPVPEKKKPQPQLKTENVKPVTIKEAALISGVTSEDHVKEETPAPVNPQPRRAVQPVTQRKAASTAADIKQEKVTKEDIEKETKKVARAVNKAKDNESYVFPDTSLLRMPKPSGSDSTEEIRDKQERLNNALNSFGVNSTVRTITHGPTVTRYDIELEQGVKLSKVTNLSNDLALSLGVSSVRIAPIPDQISTVGIEVPNKIINSVTLREIIESDNFRKSKSKLTFAIGKDIGGNAIVGNISKLPHMLIAGTTGSGKSVCMNSLIISLLFKAGPDEVKFIMIDPKMVELGIYNSIPHLYVPVVTEPKKAAGALQWSVVEMLKRYRLFSEAGVRDLETYNQYCKSNGEDTLPQVVIVIDELADLMMAASKEVEESICRVAQMGRAAGMHLVIATQRPSADVITGLMKANIPSRIAFAVSSTLESRIILDQGGADKLIGMGDMLYAPIGCGKPLRVQGAFVSDEERESIIKFISNNSGSVPAFDNEEIRQYMDKAAEAKGNSDTSSKEAEKASNTSGYDDMLSEAVEVVLEMKQCSVSMLQRRLKLGYSRAARIVDQLEELGVVGPYEGAKPRSVVIDRDGWNNIRLEMGLAGESEFADAASMNAEADSAGEEL